MLLWKLPFYNCSCLKIQYKRKYACLSSPSYPLSTVCQYLHTGKFPQYLQFWNCILAHNSTNTTEQLDLGMKIFTCQRQFTFFFLKTPQELLLKILPEALQSSFHFIAFKIYILVQNELHFALNGKHDWADKMLVSSVYPCFIHFINSVPACDKQLKWFIHRHMNERSLSSC